MGDELSKRAKFVLITWSGANVTGMKRAKMSTDKSLVKNVIRSFATEIMTSDADELSIDHVKDALQRAGGANYGTGVFGQRVMYKLRRGTFIFNPTYRESLETACIIVSPELLNFQLAPDRESKPSAEKDSQHSLSSSEVDPTSQEALFRVQEALLDALRTYWAPCYLLHVLTTQPFDTVLLQDTCLLGKFVRKDSRLGSDRKAERDRRALEIADTFLLAHDYEGVNLAKAIKLKLLDDINNNSWQSPLVNAVQDIVSKVLTIPMTQYILHDLQAFRHHVFQENITAMKFQVNFDTGDNLNSVDPWGKEAEYESEDYEHIPAVDDNGKKLPSKGVLRAVAKILSILKKRLSAETLQQPSLVTDAYVVSHRRVKTWHSQIKDISALTGKSKGKLEAEGFSYAEINRAEISYPEKAGKDILLKIVK
nr:hypothetical protein BaRGS_003799 [Batillaria attramentaria]